MPATLRPPMPTLDFSPLSEFSAGTGQAEKADRCLGRVLRIWRHQRQATMVAASLAAANPAAPLILRAACALVVNPAVEVCGRRQEVLLEAQSITVRGRRVLTVVCSFVIAILERTDEDDATQITASSLTVST